MSKKLGFNYHSHSISKHSDSYVHEEEEIFDYENNERTRIERYSKRKNIQKGHTRSFGLGYFPDPKPALKEGNSSNTVALKDDSWSTVIGLFRESREVRPKEGTEESGSDEEVDVCPINPERPGLKRKRTRKRTAKYKEGDHVSESSVGIGFNW